MRGWSHFQWFRFPSLLVQSLTNKGVTVIVSNYQIADSFGIQLNCSHRAGIHLAGMCILKLIVKIPWKFMNQTLTLQNVTPILINCVFLKVTVTAVLLALPVL